MELDRFFLFQEPLDLLNFNDFLLIKYGSTCILISFFLSTLEILTSVSAVLGGAIMGAFIRRGSLLGGVTVIVQIMVFRQSQIATISSKIIIGFKEWFTGL